MPKLFLVQAMWGMRDYPSGSSEWALDEKLERIREAGFDAIDLDIPLVVGKESHWERLLERHGLKLGLQGPFIHTLSELDACIETVRRLGSPYLDAQIGNAFLPERNAEELLRSMCLRARERGVALLVQTHRGRVTQDLQKTAKYCEAVPELRLNLDLSHYFVAGEFGPEPLPEEAESCFEVLVSRTAMIDGRVSNGHQIQIDIGPRGESPYAAHFVRLWKKAMSSWLETADPDDVFVFRPELGPPNYSILDLEGREISDRWAQAQVFAGIARRIWDEALQATRRTG